MHFQCIVVQFSNPAGVVNIFARVTGDARSDILGTLGVLGNANLFLLNPNGILFGPNARLDIRGSFFASAANSILFDNGFAFSTTNPQAPPLLTVNVPVGLQYGRNPGAIQGQGASLQVQNGQTLTLAGGTVNIDGGQLLAPGGRVEIGGVGSAGTVGLTQQGQEWRLRVPDGLSRADVAIGNDASFNVRSGGGGSIAITARNFIGTGYNTQMLAGIAENLGTVGNQARDIDINATEAVSLDGSYILNAVQPGGTGNSGDLNLTAGSLKVTNGARLDAITFGNGDAGSVKLTVSGAATFDGSTPAGLHSRASSRVGIGGRGRGGNVELTAGSLTIRNGASLSASTDGEGDAGSLKLTVSGAAAFDGSTPNRRAFSGAFSSVAPGAKGRGGNVELTAGSLMVTNEAVLNANTLGEGDSGSVKLTVSGAAIFDNGGAGSGVFAIGRGRGGNVELTAGSITATNGGILSTSTFNEGDAGNVKLTVSGAAIFDSVSGASSRVSRGARGRGGNIELTAGSLIATNEGKLIASTGGEGDAGNVKLTVSGAAIFDGIRNGRFPSGAFSEVEPGARGRGGNLELSADSLNVTNGAQLSASSNGQGGAGNLEVTARQLHLDNRGSIQAQTASGQGGNITLQVQDLLLMRQGSSISTTAGTAQAGGDGGNIIINAANGFLVTAPNENNDITANAFNGRGGNITINATGIYWFTPRSRADLERSLGTSDPAKLNPSLLLTNDITAISQGNPNLSGSVTLNTPNVDPSRGLVQLPANLTDASRLIVQTCPTGDTIAKPPNQFIITGRGGLPPTPSAAVDRDAIQVDLVTADITDQPTSSPRESNQNPSSATPPDAPIIEAQGWIVAPDGTIFLVAEAQPAFSLAGSESITPLLHHLVHCH